MIWYIIWVALILGCLTYGIYLTRLSNRDDEPPWIYAAGDIILLPPDNWEIVSVDDAWTDDFPRNPWGDTDDSGTDGTWKFPPDWSSGGAL